MAMAIVAFTVAAVASALGAAYRNQAYAEGRARALGLGRDAVESIAARSVQAVAGDAARTDGGASTPTVDLPTVEVFTLNGSAPGPAVTTASAGAGKFLVRVAVPDADGSRVTLDRVVADLSPRD